jgi:U32 family peptidase
MKIVAGLPAAATEEEVHQLAIAGAGEFFLGYLPPYWSKRFGHEFSPNRRYFAGAQIDSLAHLKSLCRAAASHSIPVAITFNEHFVTPHAMELGRRLLDEAAVAGCTSIIVADPSLVPYFREELPTMDIHVSGDAGLYNRTACETLFGRGARRVIFPRELPLTELTPIMNAVRGPAREFEAFVMGEPCVFDGARCFTEHGYDFECDFCNHHKRKHVRRRGGHSRQPLEPPQAGLLENPKNRAIWGLGKCGLCALSTLAAQGMTHIKIPGRASAALPAIRLVKSLLDSPDQSPRTAQELLGAPELCASRAFCYFPEVHDD